MAAKYKCPACSARAEVLIINGVWIWDVHDIPKSNPPQQCSLSGKSFG